MLLLASAIAGAAEKLTVYAVNYPLAYFATRIGGDHIKTVFPVPPEIDPAFWEPDARDIAGFQQADLVLLNGAGYAKWVKYVSLSRHKLVNTSASFQRDYINIEAIETHQHGPAGEHSHAGTAFTTWLDINQAVQQAKAILLALEKHRPEQADMFRQNYGLLKKDLESLDQALMDAAENSFNKPIIASHPVYQYLARRYNINLQSLMWEPEVVPDQNQWHELQQQLTTHNAKWMIWEGKPDKQTETRLQEIGINSLVFNPCANVPDNGDFISEMKSNILQLSKAYR
jgi:zinc transport system substrate-binding protein